MEQHGHVPVETDTPTPDLVLTGRRCYTLARSGLVLIWIYHGLVPKLIMRQPEEFAPIVNAGITNPDIGLWMVMAAGVAEIMVGLAMLFWWRTRWPLILTLIAMPTLLLGVACTSPRLLTGAFNPLTFNTATFLLAAIAWLLLPFSSHASDVDGSQGGKGNGFDPQVRQ
jgi:hypothetical protein